MFFLNTTHLSIELVELIRNISRLSNLDLTCSKKVKKSLIETFNIYQEKNTYISFKRKLKKLCHAYIRNHNLLVASSGYNYIFETNLVQIEKLFFETKSKFKKYSPIRYFLLNISDVIFNKRQFQKIKEISKLNLNNKI